MRKKDEVIRIVAGPDGVLIDYREKLNGRAAYICPRPDCIEQALKKDTLARAFHVSIKPPDASVFVSRLEADILNRIKALLRMAVKADKLAAGYSAVRDALEKERVSLLLYARDLSTGTREKIVVQGQESIRQETLFTREELGFVLNREVVGVVAILDKGLANAVWIEAQRLKGLINKND